MNKYDLLKKHFIYDPLTGFFTRLISRPNSPAGTKFKGAKDKWGYLLIGFDGKHYKAHRLAWLYMTGEWPEIDIDHKNGNKADNCWKNLRLATETQNLGNAKRRSDNLSGFKGVSRKKDKWEARIQINSNIIHLGVFSTKEEAANAYAEAANIYFGEFARV